MDSLKILNLFAAIFLNQNVLHLTVFQCWSIEDQVKFVQHASDRNLSIKMVHISKKYGLNDMLNRTCTERYPSKLVVILDGKCEKSMDIIEKASNLSCFRDRYGWLIIGGEKSALTSVLERSQMNVDTEIAFARFTDVTENNVELYDIYNNAFHLGGKLNVTFDRAGVYEGNKWKLGPSIINLKSKYDNRCNMKDVVMRIVTVMPELAENPSLTEEQILRHLSSINNTYVNTYPRYGYNFIMAMRDVLNFQIKWSHRDVWSFNDSGGGAFGDLISGDAEMLVSPMMMKRVRVIYVTAVLQTVHFKSIFVFLNKHDGGASGSVYLAPFAKNVWIALLVLIIAFSIFLKVVFVIECRIQKMMEFIPSWMLTILNSLGAFCQQGSTILPQTIGGRTVFLTLFLSSVLLYNYYTSSVVSSLLGTPRKSKVTNIVELADSNLDIGMEKIGYAISYLFRSHVPECEYLKRKKVLAKEKSGKLWVKPEASILRVRKGGYAYHCASGAAYYLIERFYQPSEICDLAEVTLIPKALIAMMLKKDSPFEEIMKVKFMRMKEAGIVAKHSKYWIKEKPHCLSSTIVKSVEIEYLSELFYLLLFGFFLSFLILILEIILSKKGVCCKRKNRIGQKKQFDGFASRRRST